MARVTEAEVREIIDVDDSISLTPFITAANITITAQMTGSGLAAATLKELERWLAAHFVAIRDPRTSSESIGGTSVSYNAPKLGAGLDSTPYGQQVKLLDSTGILSTVGMRRARIMAVGTTYADE